MRTRLAALPYFAHHAIVLLLHQNFIRSFSLLYRDTLIHHTGSLPWMECLTLSILLKWHCLVGPFDSQKLNGCTEIEPEGIHITL